MTTDGVPMSGSDVAAQRRPYEGLALIYDYVMRHVDYVDWVKYVDGLLKQFAPAPTTLAELACGTGNAALCFSELGYDVVGVDSSAAMVEVARGKADGVESDVPFFVRDLRDLKGLGPYDAAACLYDSFNYLMDENDVIAALSSVCDILHPSSPFVFDVCTERNSLDHFGDIHDAEEGPGFVYRRHSFYDRERRIQFNSFEISCDDEHASETHKQRIYPLRELEELIDASPFELLNAFDGFTTKRGTERSDRVHFVLRSPA